MLSELKTDTQFSRQIDKQRKKILETKIKLRMALLKQKDLASGETLAKLEIMLDENEEEKAQGFNKVHNFYCVQIDPLNGHPTSYRP